MVLPGPDWYQIGGIDGGVSGGKVEGVNVSFLYDDNSPKVISTLEPGDMLMDTELEILSAFHSSATIQFGIPGEINKFIPSNKNKPSKAGSNWGFHCNYTAIVQTQLILTIIPGASVAGDGQIVLLIRRA